MALFLQESHTQETPAVSTFDMMNSLYEYAVEQGQMTEALLRADFIVDGQMRALTEAGDEPAAKAKGEGFAAGAWKMVKAAFAKAKAMIVKVYNWIKDALVKLWGRLRSAGSTVKTFVIQKSKLAYAYAMLGLMKARRALASALLKGGNAVAPEQAAVDKAMAAVEAAKSQTGDTEIAINTAEKLTGDLTSEVKASENAAGSPPSESGSPDAAVKGATELGKNGAAGATAVNAIVTGMKPGQAK